jgi:hypothetical protein
MSMSCMFVLLVPGLLLLGVAAARWRADAARFRRAGVDGARPGCASCLYPLGGWSGPRCPECGVDVRESGVRTGPTTSRRMAGWGAGLLAVGVTLPLVSIGAGWLLHTTQATRRLSLVAGSPAHQVEFVITRDQARVPPTDEILVDVTIRPPGSGGQAPGWTGRFAGGHAVPDAVAMSQAIVTGASVDPAHPELAAAADELTRLIALGLRDGPDPAVTVLVVPPYVTRAASSSGRHGTAGWRLIAAVLLSVGAAAIAAAAAARAATRRIAAEGRAAADEEWTRPLVSRADCA